MVAAVNSKINYSELRIINNRKKRNRELKRHVLIFSLSVILFLVLVVFAFSLKSEASDGSDAPVFKQYTSVQITSGDTLYDISSRYLSADYSVNSLIEEICFINNIDSDDILVPGNYIIVPYYASING